MCVYNEAAGYPCVVTSNVHLSSNSPHIVASSARGNGSESLAEADCENSVEARQLGRGVVCAERVVRVAHFMLWLRKSRRADVAAAEGADGAAAVGGGRVRSGMYALIKPPSFTVSCKRSGSRRRGNWGGRTL